MALEHSKLVAIARIAHAANREFCLVTGDDSVKPWDEIDQDLKDTAIAGVSLLVESPATTAEELHQDWINEKAAQGWVYGECKDEDAKTHPCLVPYAELPASDRFKDTLFRSIVLSYPAFLARPEPESVEV